MRSVVSNLVALSWTLFSSPALAVLCEVPGILVERIGTVRSATAREQAELNRLRIGLRSLIDAHSKLVVLSSSKPQLLVCAFPEVNAYAVKPGEPIMVAHLLVLRHYDRPDVLATVVAHEIAHLDRGHHYYAASAFEVYLANARAVALHDYYRTRDEALATKRGVYAFKRNFNALRREQEVDADDFGTQLLVRAGYKPEIVLSAMLEMLAYSDHLRTEWFQDHPGWPERIARVEPRIIDAGIEQTMKALEARGDLRAVSRQINDWLEKLPNSGNAWLYKARVLERLKRIAYVEAYERAIAKREPGISATPDELDLVWLDLCIGLYRAGYKLESAYCSRNMTSSEVRQEFQKATFGDRLWQHGDMAGSSLLTARDESGGKFITNLQSSIDFRGLKAERVDQWRPLRFPPTDVDHPLEVK